MNTQNTALLTTPSAESAASSTSAVPAEDPNRVLVKSMLRSAMPSIITTLVAVLNHEPLGPARAYVLSDVVGAFTGDRMAAFQLSKRVAAANMTRIMGQTTGRIRAEFARPLHDQLAGIAAPETEEESEALANDTGLQ